MANLIEESRADSQRHEDQQDVQDAGESAPHDSAAPDVLGAMGPRWSGLTASS